MSGDFDESGLIRWRNGMSAGGISHPGAESVIGKVSVSTIGSLTEATCLPLDYVAIFLFLGGMHENGPLGKVELLLYVRLSPREKPP